LCCVGGGERPAMVVCRSSRKESDGDSAVSTNWPGMTSCVPNTASAGENSLSSRKVARIPNITPGRPSCQTAAAGLDLRVSFNHLWNLSTSSNAGGMQWWVSDIEQIAQGCPQGGCELGPSVGGDGGRHSEPGDPAGEEGPGAVCGDDGGKRYCLWPPRCFVDDGEQVSVAVRGQQRADQVNVDVGERGGEARRGHQLWKRCIHIKSVGQYCISGKAG
jgi:hypothetical protein